jgi:hypothetical protein
VYIYILKIVGFKMMFVFCLQLCDRDCVFIFKTRWSEKITAQLRDGIVTLKFLHEQQPPCIFKEFFAALGFFGGRDYFRFFTFCFYMSVAHLKIFHISDNSFLLFCTLIQS